MDASSCHSPCSAARRLRSVAIFNGWRKPYATPSCTSTHHHGSGQPFPIARAAEKAGEKSAEGEIRQAIAALEENFNRGDAKGLAACWTPDGEFIGPRGERIVGRQNIEAAFSEFLAAHKTSKLRLGIASWRMVADDVALVDLLTEMTPVPEGVEAKPASTAVAR